MKLICGLIDWTIICWDITSCWRSRQCLAVESISCRAALIWPLVKEVYAHMGVQAENTLVLDSPYMTRDESWWWVIEYHWLLCTGYYTVWWPISIDHSVNVVSPINRDARADPRTDTHTWHTKCHFIKIIFMYLLYKISLRQSRQD